MRNAIALVALAFLVGCATFNDKAGKSLATVASTVDAAMKGYARYVVIAQLNDTQQAPVKAAYVKYQASMTVAEKAYIELVKNNDQTSWTAALNVLNATEADLLALVSSFMKGGAK